MKAVARAPGKVILLGEHAVVYGRPALAAAIELTAEAYAEERPDGVIEVSCPDLGVSGAYVDGAYEPAEGGPEGEEAVKPIVASVEHILTAKGVRRGVRVEVRSHIPPSSGLGSSAAVSVAAAAAAAYAVGLDVEAGDVCEAAYAGERVVHGSPSGIDNTVSTYGGVLLFRAGGFRRVDVKASPTVVLGDTGVRRRTGDLVAKVRELRSRMTDVVEAVMDAVSAMALRASEALERGDLREVGELMTMNHSMLKALGVSSPELDRLVEASVGAGALGAKLTGAGGGGCMVALVEPDLVEDVCDAIREAGGKPIPTSIRMQGYDVRRLLF